MNKQSAILLSLIPILSACCKSVIIPYDAGITDYSPVVRETLEANPKGGLTLRFEAGTYPFYPEQCVDEYMVVSNNDNGRKRIAFNIKGMKDVKVEGNGTVLQFHGMMVPFSINDSQNVELEGVTIDWEDRFTMEATVTAVDEAENSVTMRILPDVEYKIENGQFFYKGYDWEVGLGENIIFDPSTRSPYYFTEQYAHWPEKNLLAEELEPGLVKFSNIWSDALPPVGGVWVDKGPYTQNRHCPGIILTDSENILVKDVHVLHAGAMALIAQYCSDIRVENYSTQQAEGNPRMVTASADATHFVDCAGTVELIGCQFESMLDDATNIHGTYMLIDSAPEPGKLIARFGHCQQEGNHFADAGDMIRFVDKTTLQPFGTAKIESIERNCEKAYAFTLSGMDLSTLEDPRQYAIENISRGIEKVIIRNCSVQHNRARSLLLSCAGKVLVDKCDFGSMMAGIRICGDANYWFESGCTQDITIRGCHFRNLGIGGGAPQAILQIDPVIPGSARTNEYYFHDKIVFEDNLVETFDDQVIYALSVKNLSIRNNRFVDSRSYDPIYKGLSVIDLQYCGKVTIDGNDFSQWREGATISSHNCAELDCEDSLLELVDRPNPYFFQN
ncbi:MAG: right-handed parallel beta-helix repeat-containing protein [Bacteroidales bacterium]|nr:right-handed parallel beta-helix repeat-containing protein [Bacteroidales bacterium]